MTKSIKSCFVGGGNMGSADTPAQSDLYLLSADKDCLEDGSADSILWVMSSLFEFSRLSAPIHVFSYIYMHVICSAWAENSYENNFYLIFLLSWMLYLLLGDDYLNKFQCSYFALKMNGYILVFRPFVQHTDEASLKFFPLEDNRDSHAKEVISCCSSNLPWKHGGIIFSYCSKHKLSLRWLTYIKQCKTSWI